MNWFGVPPLGGLEARSSTENRLKAGLRTASRPICMATCVFTCFATVAVAEDTGLLPNPGFEQGITGWIYRPGDESQVSCVDGEGDHGSIVELRPNGKLLGIETERLEIGKELQPDQAYCVEAQLKNEGLRKGVFAFSMYCFDASGKSLKQIAFYGLSTHSKPHDWKKRRGEFGPGTRNPLPEGTKSVCIRFSFYEANRDCQGTVMVDDVNLQTYEPPVYEGWPAEIVADVGDLQIRFESRSFWTLYRIDYKGDRICLDRFGSHYGSVASFPDVGFIGSGHTENENEEVVDLKLLVDGQPVDRPAAKLTCQDIRLQKRSRIRNLLLTTEISARDNRIVEDVKLSAAKPTAVNLIYHFMHPWTFTATEYLAESLDGTRVEGTFTGDKGQKIDKATRWSAIYDAPTGKGAVTYVLDAPTDDDWRTRYWDVPDVYRKHYLATFLNKTVPAGREFRYRVVIVPFESVAQRWKDTAAQVAVTCAAMKGSTPCE